MSDGFDPCECLYNQAAAMQRLISMLRESQSYCTDTECTDDPPLSNLQGPEAMNPAFYMIAFWAFIAMMLFFMRPASLRGNDRAVEGNEKPVPIGANNNNPPPPPPAI